MGKKKRKEEKEKKEKLMINAINSISIGVEDSLSKDKRRVISAIRNIYAGILLLCKHVLWNLSPDGSNGSLIYNKHKLELVEGKGIMVPNEVGHTIGKVEIEKRFKCLGLDMDWKRLNKLALVRNQVEHNYLEDNLNFAEEILALAMPVIVDIFSLLEVDPDTKFGTNIWNDILKNKEVYDSQHEICLATFSDIQWSSDIQKNLLSFVRCNHCASSLIRQKCTENTKFKLIDLKCTKCGTFQSKNKVFERAIDSLLQNAIDSDDCKLEDLKYVESEMCPYCGYRGWIDDEKLCVLCETDTAQCSRCGESFKPDELDDDSTCIGCVIFREQMQKDD